MDRDEMLRSILGHAGRARLKLSEAATAHAEALSHINGVYRLVSGLQADLPVETEEKAVDPRTSHPEWYKGINLSLDGRSYLRSRLEAGLSVAAIAAEMGVTPGAVTRHRQAWLRSLMEAPAS